MSNNIIRFGKPKKYTGPTALIPLKNAISVRNFLRSDIGEGGDTAVVERFLCKAIQGGHYNSEVPTLVYAAYREKLRLNREKLRASTEDKP